jgi:hypothetical protein
LSLVVELDGGKKVKSYFLKRDDKSGAAKTA